MKCWIWPLKVYFAHCSCIQPISPSRQSCLLSRYLNQCTAPENSKRSRYLFSRKRCLGSVSVSGLYYDDILTKLVLRVISYVQHPRDWKNHVSFFISDEIFPTYIAPSLQALSPWCVALPKVQSISNLFGGSQVGEGLGFLSFSLDWSVVGAGGPLYTPLDAQVSAYATRFAFQFFFFWWFRLTRAGVHQINQAAAYIFAILLFSAAYKQDWLGELTNVEILTKNRYHWGKETDMILNKTGGGNLPFISFSLLDRQGQSYNTSAVVNSDGTENSEAIAQLGMPFFSTAYIIGKAFVCMAAAAAFTSAILTNWSTIVSLIKREERPVDPDRQVCQQMKGFPMWWACVTCLLSLFKLLIRCPGGLGQSLSLQSQWRLQLLEWVTVGFLHGDCYVPCCSLSCWGQWVSKFYSIPWND